MMGLFRKKKSEPPAEPAEQAALKRGPDAILRRFGFTIFARVKGSEPVWTRGGHYYSESKAWIIANQEAIDAKAIRDKAAETEGAG